MKQLSLVLLAVLALAACKKQKEAPNRKFLGTYVGTSQKECCEGNYADTVVIAEGLSDTAVKITFKNGTYPSGVIDARVHEDTAFIPHQAVRFSSADTIAYGTGLVVGGNSLSITIFAPKSVWFLGTREH